MARRRRRAPCAARRDAVTRRGHLRAAIAPIAAGPNPMSPRGRAVARRGGAARARCGHAGSRSWSRVSGPAVPRMSTPSRRTCSSRPLAAKSVASGVRAIACIVSRPAAPRARVASARRRASDRPARASDGRAGGEPGERGQLAPLRERRQRETIEREIGPPARVGVECGELVRRIVRQRVEEIGGQQQDRAAAVVVARARADRLLLRVDLDSRRQIVPDDRFAGVGGRPPAASVGAGCARVGRGSARTLPSAGTGSSACRTRCAPRATSRRRARARDAAARCDDPQVPVGRVRRGRRQKRGRASSASRCAKAVCIRRIDWDVDRIPSWHCCLRVPGMSGPLRTGMVLDCGRSPSVIIEGRDHRASSSSELHRRWPRSLTCSLGLGAFQRGTWTRADGP